MAISECQQDSNSGWLGCVVRKMAIGDEHEDGKIGGLILVVMMMIMIVMMMIMMMDH